MSTSIQSSKQALDYLEPHPAVHCFPILAIALFILAAYAQVQFMAHNLMSNPGHKLFVDLSACGGAACLVIYAAIKCFYEYRQNQASTP